MSSSNSSKNHKTATNQRKDNKINMQKRVCVCVVCGRALQWLGKNSSRNNGNGTDTSWRQPWSQRQHWAWLWHRGWWGHVTESLHRAVTAPLHAATALLPGFVIRPRLDPQAFLWRWRLLGRTPLRWRVSCWDGVGSWRCIGTDLGPQHLLLGRGVLWVGALDGVYRRRRQRCDTHCVRLTFSEHGLAVQVVPGLKS